MKHNYLLHKIVFDGVPRSSDVADRINDAVPLVAEAVQDTARLKFDGPVTFRLVSPRRWSAVNKMWIVEEINQVETTDEASEALLAILRRALPFVVGTCGRLTWRGLGGQAIHRDTGASEVLVIPRATRHLGMGEKEFTAMVAHELTHVLQRAATRQCGPLIAEALKEEGRIRAPRHLKEGHAVWVHECVTEQLYGQPVTKISKNPSFTLKVTGKLATQLVPFLADKRPYTEGVAFIRSIIEQEGVDLMNRAWETHNSVPTKEEIKEPQLWVTRMRGGAAHGE